MGIDRVPTEIVVAALAAATLALSAPAGIRVRDGRRGAPRHRGPLGNGASGFRRRDRDALAPRTPLPATGSLWHLVIESVNL